MHNTLTSVLLALSLTLFACQKTADAPPGQDGNITGVWVGDITFRGQTMRIFMWIEDTSDKVFAAMSVVDPALIPEPEPDQPQWVPIANEFRFGGVSPCMEIVREDSGAFVYRNTFSSTLTIDLTIRVSYQVATNELVGEWAGNTSLGGESGSLSFKRVSWFPRRDRQGDDGTRLISLLGCAPRQKAECDDGVDNDGDGLVDGDDSSCCRFHGGGAECNLLGRESKTHQCDDGVDNDSDGLLDRQDPECMSGGGLEIGREPLCADGIDNDLDGLADLQDPDCAGDPTRYSEITPRIGCDDGVDNDNDGLTDQDDPECATLLIESLELTACNNRVDDDGDGLIDENDPTCANHPELRSELGNECSDGIDNDGDGLIDLAESTCNFAYLSKENGDSSSGAESDCVDGADNDNDGLADAQDPQCRAYITGLEVNRIYPSLRSYSQCSNGIDDDGDGLTDDADETCMDAAYESAIGNFETVPPCIDGIDNDGDGFIDAADPSCVWLIAQTENASCNDGIDNDGNDLVDLDDPNCQGDRNALERQQSSNLPACSDDQDNDYDGYYDLVDPDCENAEDDSER